MTASAIHDGIPGNCRGFTRQRVASWPMYPAARTTSETQYCSLGIPVLNRMVLKVSRIITKTLARMLYLLLRDGTQ